MTISPAAGPLIVSLAPPIREVTIPPTIAAIIPDDAGNPLATAIPTESGGVMRETRNPAAKSFVS
jgi:hypothetical protein